MRALDKKGKFIRSDGAFWKPTPTQDSVCSNDPAKQSNFLSCLAHKASEETILAASNCPDFLMKVWRSSVDHSKLRFLMASNPGVRPMYKHSNRLHASLAQTQVVRRVKVETSVWRHHHFQLDYHGTTQMEFLFGC